VVLLAGLDALDHHAQTKVLAQRNNGLVDGLVFFADGQIFRKGVEHIEVVHRK
jgi:hypothetical protein